jgi:3-deoxy-D-manno-octulosonic acid kinase
VAARLARAAIPEPCWRAIGAVIARLHRFGVDHADLNAHNILLDAHGAVSVIDFDRGRLREPGAWARGNLQRLRESLLKISAALPEMRFSAQVWEWLMAGYQAA